MAVSAHLKNEQKAESHPMCHSIPFLVHLIMFFSILSFLVIQSYAQLIACQSQLTICVLNAKGLVNLVKLAYVGSLIIKLMSHFFALSETKTRLDSGSRISISDYKILEGNGVQCAVSLLDKWGIVLSVQKDIQIVAHIPLKHSLLHRWVVAVDVALPFYGASITHWIFAVYVLCDPNLDNLSCNFQPHLTDFVCQTRGSWLLFRDMNATVAAIKCASNCITTRHFLTSFLHDIRGSDLLKLTLGCN